MSRIYTEQRSKREFITHIKQRNTINSTLIFIIKYHKYKPWLNMLPDVLSDIIMSYTDDEIEIKYEIVSVVNQYENRSYVTVHFDYMKQWNGVQLRFFIDKHFIIFCDYVVTRGKIKRLFSDYSWYVFCSYNNFMKKYYDHNKYLSIFNCQFPYTYHKKCNHKLLKREIIIAKKILDCCKILTI